ncbi:MULTISPECIES: carboxy-S-adenosyl-L-methionine synthase CmoA [unclassified Rhizobium]|uniref:carboxy-S-adenosyl-L-methionine synthase CmoA n=1 Tax=unclassified Rhizobium TaxID=2613769 RepID=UPI000DDDA37E|nr:MULTISPECIES: carboxy-S-adenosyl-L-methionine synthase CmoA [unclassified Rhizobium]MBB3446825.1 tRNA (cmo5U34)-methyltransferase [Rhizobium sp. BK379]MBB3564955.1 tRNA (cmo5U34)-methyltransferase [Rhizobium sp. BK512]
MTDQSSRLVLHMNSRDEVFADERNSVADFSFNSTVANVFDDMVSRSVPFYGEMQRMVCELARDFAQPHSTLYDIGCSTATTLLALDHVVDNQLDFVGIDNAPDMLKKAAEKIEESGTNRSIDLVTSDLHRGFTIENASVVTMLLTLQFVRPLFRERVMKTIFNGLKAHGCLLLIEKLTSEDTTFNRLFIDHYYDFKRRNGYSSIEISKKREALENVLIPYRLEENIQLLKEVGFKSTEVFFRWYNFCGIVAVK